MIVQNNQTKKQYPTTRDKWEALSDKNKALFTVIDASDPKDVTQKITNTVKEPAKNPAPKPNTGDKAGEEKKGTHKNKK